MYCHVVEDVEPCGGEHGSRNPGARMSAVKPQSASPCQCAPPQVMDMLTHLPKQLYSMLEELVVLFCRCLVCVAACDRKYVASRDGWLATAASPEYLTSVMMF